MSIATCSFNNKNIPTDNCIHTDSLSKTLIDTKPVALTTTVCSYISDEGEIKNITTVTMSNDPRTNFSVLQTLAKTGSYIY